MIDWEGAGSDKACHVKKLRYCSAVSTTISVDVAKKQEKILSVSDMVTYPRVTTGPRMLIFAWVTDDRKGHKQLVRPDSQNSQTNYTVMCRAWFVTTIFNDKNLTHLSIATKSCELSILCILEACCL